MKKNIIKSFIVILGLCIMSTTFTQNSQLTNSSRLPAKVKIVYNQQCDVDTQYSSEYTFQLQPSQTIDITPTPAAIRGKKGCDITISSIKVSIVFPDGTEIKANRVLIIRVLHI